MDDRERAGDSTWPTGRSATASAPLPSCARCLERKRVEPEAIADGVAELRPAGLLDDARYARRFAEDKRELESWGAERIARELQRRGIAPDLIEAVVADRSREAELETALLLLQRRVPPRRRRPRARPRAGRLLIRRGYDAELAYEAIRRARAARRERARRAAAEHRLPAARCAATSHENAAGSAAVRQNTSKSPSFA